MSVFLLLVLCSGPSQSSSHDLSLLYQDIFVLIFISVQTLVWNMGDKKLQKKKKWERLYARILFFFFGRCETSFSLWEIKSRITLDKAEIAEPHFPSKAVWSGPRLCATSQGGLVAVAGSVFGFSHLERREPPPSSTGRCFPKMQKKKREKKKMHIFIYFPLFYSVPFLRGTRALDCPNFSGFSLFFVFCLVYYFFRSILRC